MRALERRLRRLEVQQAPPAAGQHKAALERAFAALSTAELRTLREAVLMRDADGRLEPEQEDLLLRVDAMVAEAGGVFLR